VPFNIYANSPLFEQYLFKHGLGRDRKTIHVSRHELLKDCERSKNFRATVIESRQNAQLKLKTFQEFQEEANRDRARITQDFAVRMQEDNTKNQLLIFKLSVKGVADMILEKIAP
jgi:hypothetical protein